MSAYGPGRDAPIQLFGGFPLEQSMEEIRVQHYLALAAGNPQQSVGLQAINEYTETGRYHVLTTERPNLSRSLQHKQINKLKARLLMSMAPSTILSMAQTPIQIALTSA